ncbi:coat protein [Neurachne minor latent virus]|nr:coat protein [Neurachne minor latent virus]
MPVDPLRTIEETDELATEESNRIADLMNVFNESALTRAQCTRNDIIACHQTVDELDKCIRAVKSYVEQRTFDDLWTQAHNAGSVASAQVLTFRDLFRFKKFITSPAGQNVVRNVQAKKKLQRAGRTKHEADQVALTRLFTTQYEVRARGVTKDNGELDIKAAKIRARLEKINRKKEENIQKWDDRCPVVAGYQELTIAQVREEAWKMYLQQCAAEHRDPPPKSTRNLEAVAEKFGAEVKEDHLVQYCTNERVRAALISFGEEHIKNLEKEGTRRNVETFRNLVVIANKGEVPEIPAAGASPVDDEDTRREDTPDPEYVEDQETGRRDEEQSSETEGDSGKKAEAAGTSRPRKRGRPTASTRREREAEAAREKGKSKKQRHSND